MVPIAGSAGYATEEHPDCLESAACQRSISSSESSLVLLMPDEESRTCAGEARVISLATENGTPIELPDFCPSERCAATTCESHIVRVPVGSLSPFFPKGSRVPRRLAYVSSHAVAVVQHLHT